MILSIGYKCDVKKKHWKLRH